MSTGFDVTDEIMDQIVQSIVKVSDPEQIILFGSRAGQYYKPDSDIDLLVVSRMPFDENHNRHKEIVRILHALKNIAIPIDVLLYSHDEIEYWRDSINHVIPNALREGKVLYGHS